MTDRIKLTKSQVAELLSMGMTPRQIAREYDVSTQAVYLHMENLRADAAKEAEEEASA